MPVTLTYPSDNESAPFPILSTPTPEVPQGPLRAVALYVGMRRVFGDNIETYLSKFRFKLESVPDVQTAYQMISSKEPGYYHCIFLNDPSGCSSRDSEESWLSATQFGLQTFLEGLKGLGPEHEALPLFLVVPFSRMTKFFVQAEWYDGFLTKPVVSLFFFFHSSLFSASEN